MYNSKLPYISVIITAYKRDDFLLNAIKSVINQTLDKKYYEIIVIKNFTDNTIDTYIKNYHIRGIVSKEESLFGKLVEALNIANGQIISFLEDDDLFSSDKLEIVYNKFKDNNNLCYYHNDHITVDEKYQKIDSKIGKSPAFNLSSISVKKSILNLNNIKSQWALDHFMYLTDQFMYLLALESDQKIIAGNENLTYYMLHGSASHINTKDINIFINFRSVNIEKDIQSFTMFDEIFISRKAKKYIKQKITNIEIDGYILGKNKKPRNILNIFNKSDRSFSTSLKIYLAYLLVRVHYNFRYIIIKKLLNNNKRS